MTARVHLKRQILAAMVVGAGFAATLWLTTEPDPAAHTSALVAMSDIGTAHARLQQLAVATRFGLLHRDGRLNETLSVIDAAHDEADRFQRLSVGDRVALVDASDDLRRIVLADRATVEQLKSEVSRYRDSLGYLPLAVAALQEHPPAGQQGTEAVRSAQDLTRLALAYDAVPSPVLADELATAQARAQSLTVDDPHWGLLLSHARLVIDNGPQLVDTLEHLRDGEVERALDAFHSEYVHAHQEMMRYRRWARTVSYGLVVLGFLLFVNLLRGLHRVYATLETRVSARTQLLATRSKELSRAASEMRLILDNVHEGLVTVDVDGQLSPQRSAILETWLGTPREGHTLWRWLEGVAPDVALWLELGWEDLQSGVMPVEVVIDQLPSRLCTHGRSLRLTYRPIHLSGSLQSVLVVLTDVTAAEEQTRLRAEQTETMALFAHIARDRDGFAECLNQTRSLLERLSITHDNRDVAMRIIHTIKGNVGMYGIDCMVSACHTLEERLTTEHRDCTAADVDDLSTVWMNVEQRIDPFLAVRDSGPEISHGDVQHLLRQIERGLPHPQLTQLVDQWSHEPMTRRLQRLANQSKQTAIRLGRTIEVSLQDNGVRLPISALAPLWAAVPHLIRNAIDHGIEPDNERLNAGKSRRGLLTLSTELHGDGVVIAVSDDGSGIDWEAIRRRAVLSGLPHRTPDDLVDALFTDGLSSRDDVSTVSGRGVGMAAVRQAIHDLDGHIQVWSKPGRGTHISCHIPLATLSDEQRAAS